MKENVVITNNSRLEKIKEAISREGAGKLHIISDFDRTLTYAFVAGEKRPSLIFILRDGNYLTPDYARKAHILFNKYHPIEVNPDIPLDEKKRAMEQWWETHFDLLIRSGLNKKDVESVVSSEKVKFRDGALKFIDFLHSCNIPLVIMSSTGLGGNAISLYLERVGLLYDNICIISNFFQWDKEGNAIGYRKPIIHSMNKDKTVIRAYPEIYEKIKARRNVLLLGDGLGDVGMVEGFDYKNLLKVGFLNEEVEKNLEHYKKVYDVLILNDSSLEYVNKLVSELTRN